MFFLKKTLECSLSLHTCKLISFPTPVNCFPFMWMLCHAIKKACFTRLLV
jgi:hypothetical protein